MATNYNNDKIVSYSGDINTAPDKYTTLTGTFSSVGKNVTGVGTLFTSEIGGGLSMVGQPTIVAGGYLFNGVDEVREILDVITDTNLVLKNAFTSDVLAGTAVKFVQESRVKQMSFVVTSGTAVVDGVTLVLAESSGFGDTAANNIYTLNPIIINSVGGTVHLTKMTAN